MTEAVARASVRGESDIAITSAPTENTTAIAARRMRAVDRGDDGQDDGDREIRRESQGRLTHHGGRTCSGEPLARAGQDGEDRKAHDDEDRVLVDRGEDERRDERHEGGGQQAAERDDEVEAGQVDLVRPVDGEPAVDGDGEDRVRREKERHEHDDRPAARQDERDPHQRRGGRDQALGDRQDAPATGGERDDEAGQVDRQRPDPQERRRDEVRCEVGRRRREETGRDDRGDQPQELAPARQRRRLCDRRTIDRRRRPTPADDDRGERDRRTGRASSGPGRAGPRAGCSAR